jgi:branched-chain amino acid transport system substrate-binding protein
MKTLKIVIILAVLALIAWGLSSLSGNKAPVETGPIKIGVITPLSGDAASLGEFIKMVTDLAVEEVNKDGGVNGRGLELVYEDSHCDAKGGLGAAQKLVSIDKVKIIIASDCSSGVLAALPFTDQAGVFMFSAGATSPELTGKSSLFARTIGSDDEQGKMLALAAINRGYQKISVIQESTDFAMGIFEAFENNFPAEKGTISKQEYPSATTDFRSILAKAKAQNPDALFLIPQSPGTADRLIKQFGETGWKVQLIANDTIAGNPEQIVTYKQVLEGAITSEPGADQTNAKYLALDQKYTAKYGKQMAYSTYGQYEYDLVYILTEGLKKYGEDPVKIAAWVRTIKDWDGASGKVTIDSNGDREGGRFLEIIKDGKTEVITQ